MKALTTMSLGTTICRLRKQKNYKQADLAEQLGIHQTLVARWETDKIRPRQKNLARLAEVLEVTQEELVAAEKGEIGLSIEDPELLGLLRQLPKLGESQRSALKTVLQDMLKLSDLEFVMKR